MQLATLASLAFAIKVTAFATHRDVSLADDRAIHVREELAADEPVPKTADDIWGDLTGDNNCLGCQVRRDLLDTYPYEELASDLAREFY